ncbi:Mycoplasma protein of unknown function, DUF285 [Seminavis robusta]|uniref:Uncharacterized protein n=1 Tax=Seminavis robusta TaxID=568900 RepID=A0A9N8E1Y9_9STRA|nr:Mycoplasma protein of unknown function, DUF285 [Seminavis robusta]|eukprot:Sro426_g140420.1 Mycoplasma protein of unknown function, DUF285 (226) ;mRNA; r:32305-33221
MKVSIAVALLASFAPTVIKCDDTFKAFETTEELKRAVQRVLDLGTEALVEYGPMSAWKVEKITNMDGLFANSDFEREYDLRDWDTSSVTSMNGMFQGSSISNMGVYGWDVSRVQDMSSMFSRSAYNTDLNNWDVSKVVRFSAIFEEAAEFNQDISGWNVKAATDMENMFAGAEKFNQNLCKWGRVVNSAMVESFDSMFIGTSCEIELDPDMSPSSAPAWCHTCSK